MLTWRLFLSLALIVVAAQSFVYNSIATRHSTAAAMDPSTSNEQHPFCLLPGDPSLILTTNVDLGDKKMEIMKGKQLKTGQRIHR